MVAVVQTIALTGFRGACVEVETDMKAGLPSMHIVGMGNKAIDEARERVRSAIGNSLLTFPPRKLVVNLAPAELPKDGTQFDVPIALSVLVASGQLKQREVGKAVFAGELALDGRLRPIRGAIVIAEAARDSGASRVFLPIKNAPEATLVSGIEVFGVADLKSLYLHLKQITLLVAEPPFTPTTPDPQTDTPTLNDIAGHQQAKRALVIAAAGRHNLLLSGPPGVGKTLLARALPSLLPTLSGSEILEVTKLHSLTTGTDGAVHTVAPFRAPHHTATLLSLLGGGAQLRPGEVSLAHHGVLFLDELPEYSRQTLEALRQPLEDRTIVITRSKGSVSYPASFIFIATMNPCPCGYAGSPSVSCRCSATQIMAYQKKLSGPLLDRIDLQLQVNKQSPAHIFDAKSLQINQHIKVLKSISETKQVQENRYKCSGVYNAYASQKTIQSLFYTTPAAEQLLATATTRLHLTHRSTLKVLRVARTIADLAASTTIQPTHVAEALQFRAPPPL